MKKRVNEGLRTYRFRDNPEEKRIADAWEVFETQGNIVDCILDTSPNQGSGRPPPALDHDRVVAATILQWLGTPVGQYFLTEVLGYSRPTPPPPKSTKPKQPKKSLRESFMDWIRQ